MNNICIGNFRLALGIFYVRSILLQLLPIKLLHILTSNNLHAIWLKPSILPSSPYS